MLLLEYMEVEALRMNFKVVSEAIQACTEEQAKQLLMEILTAKSYSNQELIQKVQEITEQLEQQ